MRVNSSREGAEADSPEEETGVLPQPVEIPSAGKALNPSDVKSLRVMFFVALREHYPLFATPYKALSRPFQELSYGFMQGRYLDPACPRPLQKSAALNTRPSWQQGLRQGSGDQR
jgi:hypothetical protein